MGALLVLAAAAVLARGPVVVGVGSDEAWISWETAERQSDATVQYGKPGAATLSASDSAWTEHHHVHLTGLDAGASYEFVVDTDPNQEVSSFRTAPAARGGTVRFAVYGDNRTNAADHQSVADALAKEPGLDFLVHTGDMAQNYPFAQEWDDFFRIEHQLLRTHALVPTIGNHETLDTLVHWGDFFAAPAFSVTSPVRYYSTDWGDVHVAVVDTFDTIGPTIDSNQDSISDAQLEWLKADLEAAQRAGRTSFVSLHHGPFSHATGPSAHGGSELVRTVLLPELVRRGVVAVFAGHDHLYERGCNGGMDYFVAGGGGAPLYPVDASAPGVLAAASALSYVVISVESGRVSGVAKTPDGRVFDQFTLPTSGCSAAPDAGTSADGGTAAPPPASAGNGSSGCSAGPAAGSAALLPLLASFWLRRKRQSFLFPN